VYPLFSILICTRNRLPQLQKTLATIGEVHLPKWGDGELIVVDNGSTDETFEWLKRYKLPNLTLRAIQEPRAGTGYARNAALKAAQGDILLFTDDDVRVPPEWVRKMAAPIWRDGADVVAGTSRLHKDVVRPWMGDFHTATLSSTAPVQDRKDVSPITINMAFSRRVLKKVPAFDPELGPGSCMGFLEDTLFTWQLREAGFRFDLVDDATVVHRPHFQRLCRSAYLRAARARGRSMAYVRYHWLHWDAWNFTNRTVWHQWWRSPILVWLKRKIHLVLWRAAHYRQVKRKEGISAYEFGLVNGLHQIKQYLIERHRPRNYSRRGLVKRHGKTFGHD
jgi:glycosyltransferase involved in cell wall biosynthesis